MNKSYLINDKEEDFERKTTYLDHNMGEEIFLDYSILPEDYDVFSQIKMEILSECTPDQNSLFNQIINQVRNTLKLINHKYGIIKQLPKMELYLDSEKAIILNWPYSLYRIYFDIERNIIESFYGIVVYESESSIQTKTESFDSYNCEVIINQIIQYIFNHT